KATASVSVTALNKTYDGTTTATFACILANVAGSESVTCSGNANFSSANAGTWTVTIANIALGGAAAGNYVLSSTTVSTNAMITPKPVIASVTANNKPYDKTTSATITSCTLAGLIAGDLVTCSAASATFSDANVGNNKT